MSTVSVADYIATKYTCLSDQCLACKDGVFIGNSLLNTHLGKLYVWHFKDKVPSKLAKVDSTLVAQQISAVDWMELASKQYGILDAGLVFDLDDINVDFELEDFLVSNDVTVTADLLNHLSGITSNVQDQINSVNVLDAEQAAKLIQLLGDGNIAGYIADLVSKDILLDADILALQNEDTSIKQDIIVLQGQVGTRDAQITALQAADLVHDSAITSRYTKAESDAGFGTKTTQEAQTILIADRFTKSESDARFYQQSEAYSSSQADAACAPIADSARIDTLVASQATDSAQVAQNQVLSAANSTTIQHNRHT